jgi:hypothetical protein
MPSAVLATAIQDRVTNAKYYFFPAALQGIQKSRFSGKLLTLATQPIRWQFLSFPEMAAPYNLHFSYNGHLDNKLHSSTVIIRGVHASIFTFIQYHLKWRN